MSLFRLAPIISVLEIDQPSLHIIRTGPRSFNCSDLLPNPTRPKATDNKPFRFAISNIRLRDGRIRFDDKVLSQQHAIERIQLGIPFIASLPADANIYVKPALQMMVDGSPLRVTGKALLFRSPMKSTVVFSLRRFDLSRLNGYLPQQLPLRIPHGALSCALTIDFISSPSEPLLRLAGQVGLDQLDLRDASNGRLLSLKTAALPLNDVEPLRAIFSLGKIRIDGFASNVIVNQDGTTNLAALVGTSRSSGDPTKLEGNSNGPANISLESLEMSSSSISVALKKRSTSVVDQLAGRSV
jgi:uncharacterized protein involved in outer membrane biogenesis